MAEDKPSVLVLGGCGFVGRHLVKLLVDQNLASKIRVADKVPPAMAYLSSDFATVFESEAVEFVQGNLSREQSVAKAFTKDDSKFTHVFNCAGMTKYGQAEAVYSEHIFNLSVACATEAAKHGVKLYVEMSTSQVYGSSKAPAKEDGKIKPWTKIADQKLKVEQKLASIAGLNYIVVRPAIIYGVADMSGLTPRMICAAVYTRLSETMKLLWTKKLKLNTVHVEDVAAGMWHLANSDVPSGSVFNMADSSETSQGTLNILLSEMFGIDHNYAGSVISNLARLNMKSITEDVNDKHMDPWMKMCQENSVTSTPLTPYLDQELLYNHDTWVDGSKITTVGFQYGHPTVTNETLSQVVACYIEQGLFPAGCLK